MSGGTSGTQVRLGCSPFDRCNQSITPRMCIRIAGDVSCHDSYGFPSGQPFYPADTTLGAPTTWGAIPQTVALAAAINNESKPCVHTVAAAASVLPADVYGPGRAACGSWCRRTRYCCNRRSLRTCPHRAKSGSRLTPVTPATPPGTSINFPPIYEYLYLYISPVYIVCRNSQRSDGRDLLRICEPPGRADRGAVGHSLMDRRVRHRTLG